MAAMTGRAGWMPWWAWAWPALAWILLIVALADGVGGAFAAVMAVVLIGTVFAAVHHAEVSAHRIGEPFGTLVLAVAVTVIEVGLIVSIMLALGPGRAELARDTVFAAVVLLAKALSPTLEAGIARVGAPKTLVGVVIAAIVLLPEAVAALRAAWADLLQTSLNLALGSAPASIGLTIPAVAVVSIVLGRRSRWGSTLRRRSCWD